MYEDVGVDDELSASAEHFLLCLLAFAMNGLCGGFAASAILSAGVSTWLEAIIALVGFACVCVFALVARNNNFFIHRNGLFFLLGVSLVGVCVGLALVTAFSPFFTLLCAIGFSALLFAWVRSLALLDRRKLAVLLSVLFVTAALGLFGAMFLDSAVYRAVASGVFCFVSCAVSFVVHTRYGGLVAACHPLDVSRKRRRLSKSNFSKEFSEGLVLGLALLMVCRGSLGFEGQTNVVALCLLVVALVGMLVRTRASLAYERIMNWWMVPVYTALFVAYPWCGQMVQLVLMCVALALALCFVQIFLSACAEYSRQFEVSCFYMFGREGAQFFGGVLFAGALSVLAQLALRYLAIPSDAVLCGCAIIVLACLNVDIVKGGYPVSGESGAAIERRVLNEGAPKLDTLIDSIASKYGLSSRQQQVLSLLMRGNSIEQIAKRLDLSEATVKSHIYAVNRKTETLGRQELIDFVEKSESSEIVE